MKLLYNKEKGNSVKKLVLPISFSFCLKKYYIIYIDGMIDRK